MNLRLKKLGIKNFKGVSSFVFEPHGKNATIYGDNATGKTTLADAFYWLLFDKDSLGKKDFEIKTLDAGGSPAHGLDHEVEAVLQLDEKRSVLLKKVYTEKWTKKRGEPKAALTGHTTSYFVDEVPVPMAEYKQRIADLVDESTFRLLADPRYFPELIHWQKRRELLLSVCGDVADAGVIAADEQLAQLPDILAGRSIAEHKAVVTAKRKKINETLKTLPARIDEVSQTLPDLSGTDAPEKLRATIAWQRRELNAQQERLARIAAGGEVAAKLKRLAEIDAELIRLDGAKQAEINAAQRKKAEALSGEHKEMSRLLADAEGKKRSMEHIEVALKETNSRIERLREEWQEVAGQKFIADEQKNMCPACGQNLPAEKIVAAREAALAAFNLRQSEELTAISERGKLAAKERERLYAEREDVQAAIADLRIAIKATEARILDVERKGESEGEIESPFGPARSLRLEKEHVEAEIRGIQAAQQKVKEDAREEIGKYEQSIKAAEKALYEHGRREALLARIEELKDQERQLAAEYEQLESELFLTELFTKTRTGLVEDRINSKFKLAKFKMFNTLVNGAIEECCEVLYEGVPYSGGLNHGARFNVGLDIINTLAEHYGVSVPIFVDNAEAVTQLLPTVGQQIRLVVSEEDKELRVVENN